MSFTQYSKDIHEKANNVGKELVELMVRNTDVLLPELIDHRDPQDAEKAKKQEQLTYDFSMMVMDRLAKSDIPAHYATLGIEKLIDALTGLKTFVNGTINSYNDEYLSRMYGFKNEEGKFRMEVATVGQLLLKLKEARDATGGKMSDFFNGVQDEEEKKDEELSPIPSPLTPEDLA